MNTRQQTVFIAAIVQIVVGAVSFFLALASPNVHIGTLINCIAAVIAGVFALNSRRNGALRSGGAVLNWVLFLLWSWGLLATLGQYGFRSPGLMAVVLGTTLPLVVSFAVNGVLLLRRDPAPEYAVGKYDPVDEYPVLEKLKAAGWIMRYWSDQQDLHVEWTQRGRERMTVWEQHIAELRLESMNQRRVMGFFAEYLVARKEPQSANARPSTNASPPSPKRLVQCPQCATEINVGSANVLVTTCPSCQAMFLTGENEIPELEPLIEEPPPAIPAATAIKVLAPTAEPIPAATPQRPRPGFGEALLWSFGIVVVFGLLPGFIGGVFLGVTGAMSGMPLKPEELVGRLLPWITVGQLSSIVTIAVMIPFRLGPGWAKQIGLRPPKPLHVVLALLALPGLMVIDIGIAALAQHAMPDWFGDESFTMMEAWPWYFGVLAIGLAPAVGEELWFRAFMGRGLIGRHGVLVGVLLTSLLFGLVHINPLQVVITFVIGIMLHLAYLASGSLFIPMLLHALNNTLLVLAVHHPRLGMNDLQTEDIPWLLYVAALGLTAVAGWAAYRTRVRTAEETPTSAEAPPPRAVDWVAWLAPLAAAVVFWCVAAPAAVALHARVSPMYPDVPAPQELNSLLIREPITVATWPQWSRRLREWLPDRSPHLVKAYDAAREFLVVEFKKFKKGEPESPIREDAMAWYIHGRGTLRMIDGVPAMYRGKQAEPLLRRSIELDPKIGQAHYALAVALLLQVPKNNMTDPRIEESRREAELGEKLDPTTSAKAAEAWVAMLQGRYEDAERLYREVVQERPRDKEMKRAAEEAAALRRRPQR